MCDFWQIPLAGVIDSSVCGTQRFCGASRAAPLPTAISRGTVVLAAHEPGQTLVAARQVGSRRELKSPLKTPITTIRHTARQPCDGGSAAVNAGTPPPEKDFQAPEGRNRTGRAISVPRHTAAVKVRRILTGAFGKALGEEVEQCADAGGHELASLEQRVHGRVRAAPFGQHKLQADRLPSAAASTNNRRSPRLSTRCCSP